MAAKLTAKTILNLTRLLEANAKSVLLDLEEAIGTQQHRFVCLTLTLSIREIHFYAVDIGAKGLYIQLLSDQVTKWDNHKGCLNPKDCIIDQAKRIWAQMKWDEGQTTMPRDVKEYADLQAAYEEEVRSAPQGNSLLDALNKLFGQGKPFPGRVAFDLGQQPPPPPESKRRNYDDFGIN